MTLLEKFKKEHIKKTHIPEFRPGYTVRVHQKIQEKDKERIQIFEGVVISRNKGNSAEATFTVRKITSGVGVERIFPLHSPRIAKIEVVKRAQPRRAKLYYLRRKQREKMRREERVKEKKKVKENKAPKTNKIKTKKAPAKKAEKREEMKDTN